MTSRQPQRAPSTRAFTLIETAIAVGIVATVLLALVALIPVGLGSLRDSNAQAAHARITQAIAADYRLRDWDTLTSTSTTEYYFDRRGIQLPGPTSTWLRWMARATVNPGVALPGADTSNAYTRKIEIAISGELGAADPYAPSPQLTTHTTTVSKFDK